MTEKEIRRRNRNFHERVFEILFQLNVTCLEQGIDVDRVQPLIHEAFKCLSDKNFEELYDMINQIIEMLIEHQKNK